ncbi:MAG: LysR family transcriptional regulator [Myxococcales bacterium]
MKEREELRWDDVRVFLAIRRQKTMSGAARDLGIDQTTVGRRLASLETSLDARLFDRRPDGLVLTPAGESVVDAALHIEETILALERRALGQDRRSDGIVRIATSDTYAVHYLLPRLAPLRGRHPGLTLEISTRQSFVALARREADLALRLRPKGSPPAQENVICRRLADVSWAMHASRAYLDSRADGEARGPDDFSHDEVVDLDESAAGLPGGAWLRGVAATATVGLRVSGILPTLAAVLAGQGLGLLPCFIAAAAGLARVGPVRAWAEAWLLVHPDLQHVARVRTVMDEMVAMHQRDAPLLAGETT